ncbi:MAG: hypothetical protein LBR67_03050 [Dysgonamonadaceae bacterium]|nr:hypothetical protein [Dysgonamonadaceae bacterium]
MRKQVLLFSVIAAISVQICAQETPAWAKDLIIYEIVTKAFTSPNGPESGTFNSAREKLPYLEKMGITGIWLNGTNLGDPRHFYNIWTQYGCIDPSKLDPTLGTPADFKTFIDDAHSRGMKVFMDIITHGVMNDSPLVKEHPDWFRGGSWGMTDFDWSGEKKALDEWWVKTFTDWVVDYGVDGFRLDVDIYRPDLWKRIKQQAAAAGHPIIVFSETWFDTEGAADFMQRMTPLSNQRSGPDYNILLHRDVAKHYQSFDYFRIIEADIYYSDGSNDKGYFDITPLLDPSIVGHYNPHPEGRLKLTLLNHPAPPTPERQDAWRIRIDNVDPDKVIDNIVVKPLGWWKVNYQFGRQGAPLAGLSGSKRYDISVTPFVPDRLLYSVQLSSHDDGWESYPQDKNPYVAQGSRSMFGYSFLLTPAIPFFLSGEEFNADFVPLPTLTPDLAGKGEPGRGKWMVGSMIDWSQLTQRPKQEMLDDVTRMIAIRKAEADIFRPVTTDRKPNIKAVPLQTTGVAGDSIPVPFMLFNDNKAIVVCGNNTAQTVRGKLNISLKDTPLEHVAELQITDLWNGGNPKKVKPSDLEHFSVTMKPDKIKRGGLAVFKIE